MKVSGEKDKSSLTSLFQKLSSFISKKGPGEVERILDRELGVFDTHEKRIVDLIIETVTRIYKIAPSEIFRKNYGGDEAVYQAKTIVVKLIYERVTSNKARIGRYFGSSRMAKYYVEHFDEVWSRPLVTTHYHIIENYKRADEIIGLRTNSKG